jgi:ankyrin repeat protein
MNNNDTALINAIESNSISLVASLISDGSANVNARLADMRNGSVLHLAAYLGHVEIVALLLNAGACIDDDNNFHDTACHAAVREGHDDVASLLAARNADLSLRNRAAETPISIAIKKKNKPLMMLLIDAAVASGRPLDAEDTCVAATVDIDVILTLLFKHRINLSAIRGDSGRTPLHEAVVRNSPPGVIDMLIGVAGVDIDARGQMGFTVTHMACLKRDIGVLARVVAAGANVEQAGNYGDTPLHFTQFDSSGPFAELLLACGASVHARNNKGRTPCHRASHSSLPALLAFGANLDQPDNDGVTPRRLLRTTLPTTQEIALARRRVLNVRLSLVRKRAIDVCIALQLLDIDALCMCEILLHSCGPVAPLVPFHNWWQIATTVKHWRQ